jgi:hypothetical protein
MLFAASAMKLANFDSTSRGTRLLDGALRSDLDKEGCSDDP